MTNPATSAANTLRATRTRLAAWRLALPGRRAAAVRVARSGGSAAARWLREYGLVTAVGLCLLALVSLALWLVWVILSAIGRGLDAAGSVIVGAITATPDAAAGAWHSFTAWEITRSATEPIRAYLGQHDTALPASASQVWTTGLITAAVLLTLSWMGSWGARIGWTVLGIAAVAAAHAGAPAASAGLSAGITAAFWGVASVLAFAGVGRPRPHINHITVDARPANPAVAA
jgi:hypothetical protein